MAEAVCCANAFSRSHSGWRGVSCSPTSNWPGYRPFSNDSGCIQSRLRAFTKTFCKVEVMVDADGNALADQHGNPKIKVPNPRIELPYTYLVARSFIKRRITGLWGRTFTHVGQMQSEYSTVFWPQEIPLFSRGEEVDLLFLAIVEKACLRDLHHFKERVQSLTD